MEQPPYGRGHPDKQRAVSANQLLLGVWGASTIGILLLLTMVVPPLVQYHGARVRFPTTLCMLGLGHTAILSPLMRLMVSTDQCAHPMSSQFLIDKYSKSWCRFWCLVGDCSLRPQHLWRAVNTPIVVPPYLRILCALLYLMMGCTPHQIHCHTVHRQPVAPLLLRMPCSLKHRAHPISQDAGTWSPAGTWLVDPGPGAPSALTCQTSHLSAFTIQPVPRIWAISGCGRTVGNMSLDCYWPVPALTITGGNFGSSGAQVVLRSPSAEVPCRSVQHAPEQPDSVLLCFYPELPPEPLPPSGLWVAVQVITQYGTAHTLDPAVMFAGAPMVTALLPLSGQCVPASARGLAHCPSTGADFAIRGEGLVGFGPTRIAVGPNECPEVVPYNTSYVECRGVTGIGDHNVTVSVGVHRHRRRSAAAGFTVSFADPCAAIRGFWAAPDCVVCKPGYYGPACVFRCPVAASGAVCNGRGVCDDGVAGAGACACDADPVRGYWTGVVCSRCQDGYVGLDCRGACPQADPYAAGINVTCSSHGACVVPGVCECVAPWVGRACDVLCPADAAFVPCSGHGQCGPGATRIDGVCTCAADPLSGFWAGPSCGGCAEGWVGPACAAMCPGLEAAGGGCAGHGQCVWNGSAAHCECDALHVGPDCAQACPLGAPLQVCSARGQCVAGTRGARCACTRDLVAGHWAGPACDMCAADYAGADCRTQCPRDSAGAVCASRGNCTRWGACVCLPGTCGTACEQTGDSCVATCPPGLYGPQCEGLCACGVHGTCQDGPYGSGACVCDAGWVGVRCEAACEGGASGSPCSGHGQCDPVNGTCLCAPGYRTLPGTPACAVPCPGLPGIPCRSNGFCNATAHCECDPGYGGVDCGLPCPRDADGRACSGHGYCAVTGQCACAGNAAVGHWGGADCNSCAPGYFGPGCVRVCQATGLTIGRECTCAVGYAGEDCGQLCPGGPANPCSSHGTCSALTALCECRTGYGGRACELQCPRSAASHTPCSGHGACDVESGTCACDDSDAGHWSGPACDECLGEYYGAACTFLCPTDAAGTRCAGHGTCTSAGGCRCYRDLRNGHWAGPVCTVCAPGHYGADCRGECPGGACNPCGGHGTCHEGRSGNGTCACDSGPGLGHWESASGCMDCRRGWYGPMCLRPCPGGAALPCGGHGVCSGGVYGSGACACTAGPATGFWVGSACGECAAGYYGAECTVECPGGALSPCNGVGTCAAGRTGTGACVCGSGFVGPACEGECVRSAGGAPCNGHGACQWDARTAAAACTCYKAPARGYWTGAGCGACRAGYFGGDCAAACPGGAAGPCTGHGTCSDGPAGTGRCSCGAGYAGPDCAKACPGVKQGRVCNGHGQCDPASGTCVCARDGVAGHWAGAGCEVCAEGWAGAGCAVACPRDAALGAVCGGQGACVDGTCVCIAGACGAACELSGTQCKQCPPAIWGGDCQFECPGGVGSPCNGHGQCLDGALGSGRCVCARGYGMTDCGRACPGDQGKPCSGHGSCSTATAQCHCDAGYAGPACGIACPRDHTAAVCSGPEHGMCNDGATGTGNCTCALGFAGAACEFECRGMGPAGPCNGQGRCAAATGECMCGGHWGGAECDRCQNGWYGPGCGKRCYQGTSMGQLCVCFSGWARHDCSAECVGGASNPCSGHGVCNDTRTGDGTCTCDAEWRSRTCAVPCAGLLTNGRACAGHGACNASGACTCARSEADGYWTGEACTHCAHGYAGLECMLVCPGAPGVICGGHGACNAVTAACECYQGPEAGYWAQPGNCTDCLMGYWGPQCQSTCPGGTCNICSGHGQCADGIAGDGACACDPHWEGVACSQCVPGWYGLDCNSSCPMALDTAGDPAVCGGHGLCLDGLYGTGECICAQSAAAGMWAGADCGACVATHWGADCLGTCPKGSGGQVCAGHGTCRDGRDGDGVCACASFWGGSACERTCPAAEGRVCNGVGACDVDSGVCDCSGAPFGFWRGPACAKCQTGYVGEDCAVPCPTGGVLAAVCSGHGRCSAVAVPSVAAQEVARCACDPGHYGPSCAAECPGGALLQCSGHGQCDPVNGMCQCARSAGVGYWAGEACGRCLGGWSGPQCTLACPLGVGGMPCSGQPCHDGVCECGTYGCGAGCNVTGVACDSLFCPEGFWGPDCANMCPRNASGVVCSARGECLSTTFSDGLCRCMAGFAGPDCGLVCAVQGPSGVCSGTGDCSPLDGACICYLGFAGRGCEIQCPLSGGRMCGGHGSCNDGAAGDGTCGCDLGYAGQACALLCPGLDPDAKQPVVCGGHGHCLSDSAQCSCNQTPEGDAAVPHYTIDAHLRVISGMICKGNAVGGGGLRPAIFCTFAQFSAIFRNFSAIAFGLSTLRACCALCLCKQPLQNNMLQCFPAPKKSELWFNSW